MGEKFEPVAISYTCDSCQKIFEVDERLPPFEAQEMLHWENRGGYSSIFGDGEEITLDLCQHCIKEILGHLLQFHGNAYFPPGFEDFKVPPRK